MALPQWTGAGSKVSAPRLSNIDLFAGLRDSVSKLSAQHEKRKDLEKANKRIDAIRLHEEQVARDAANQNHDWNIESQTNLFDQQNNMADRNETFTDKQNKDSRTFKEKQDKKDKTFTADQKRLDREFTAEQNRLDRALRKKMERIKFSNSKKLSKLKNKTEKAGVDFDVTKYISYKDKVVTVGETEDQLKAKYNKANQERDNKINKEESSIKSELLNFQRAKKIFGDNPKYNDDWYKENINKKNKSGLLRVELQNYRTYKDRYAGSSTVEDYKNKLQENILKNNPEIDKSKYKATKVIKNGAIDLSRTRAQIANAIVKLGLKSPQVKAVNSAVDEFAHEYLQARNNNDSVDSAKRKGAVESATKRGKELLKKDIPYDKVREKLIELY